MHLQVLRDAENQIIGRRQGYNAQEANYWYVKYLSMKAGLKKNKPTGTLRVKDY